MNTAILISFIVPAIVAITLTVMLLKERDHFMIKNRNYRSNKSRANKNSHFEEEKNKLNNLGDFSGGIMGI